jgi:hypothetical protein
MVVKVQTMSHFLERKKKCGEAEKWKHNVTESLKAQGKQYTNWSSAMYLF